MPECCSSVASNDSDDKILKYKFCGKCACWEKGWGMGVGGGGGLGRVAGKGGGGGGITNFAVNVYVVVG